MASINLDQLNAYLDKKINITILDARCPLCSSKVNNIQTYLDTTTQILNRIDVTFLCGLKISKRIKEELSPYLINARCGEAHNILLQQKLDEVLVAQDSNQDNVGRLKDI